MENGMNIPRSWKFRKSACNYFNNFDRWLEVPVVIELKGTLTGNSMAKNEDFDCEENELKLEWQWNHNPYNISHSKKRIFKINEQ